MCLAHSPRGRSADGPRAPTRLCLALSPRCARHIRPDVPGTLAPLALSPRCAWHPRPAGTFAPKCLAHSPRGRGADGPRAPTRLCLALSPRGTFAPKCLAHPLAWHIRWQFRSDVPGTFAPGTFAPAGSFAPMCLAHSPRCAWHIRVVAHACRPSVVHANRIDFSACLVTLSDPLTMGRRGLRQCRPRMEHQCGLCRCPSLRGKVSSSRNAQQTNFGREQDPSGHMR